MPVVVPWQVCPISLLKISESVNLLGMWQLFGLFWPVLPGFPEVWGGVY